MQVTAWRDLKPKLDDIEQDGVVVHLTSLLSTIPKNQVYNGGNETFELLIRENSEVIVYGQFEDSQNQDLTPVKVEIKNLREFINRKVEVSGYVKTMLGSFKTMDSVFSSGSICDGAGHKVEVNTVVVGESVNNRI